jgi:hypothetical protein
MAQNSLTGLCFVHESREIVFKIVGKAYGSVYLCRSYLVFEPEVWGPPEYELVDIANYQEYGFKKSVRRCKKLAIRGVR